MNTQTINFYLFEKDFETFIRVVFECELNQTMRRVCENARMHATVRTRATMRSRVCDRDGVVESVDGIVKNNPRFCSNFFLFACNFIFQGIALTIS